MIVIYITQLTATKTIVSMQIHFCIQVSTTQMILYSIQITDSTHLSSSQYGHSRVLVVKKTFFSIHHLGCLGQGFSPLGCVAQDRRAGGRGKRERSEGVADRARGGGRVDLPGSPRRPPPRCGNLRQLESSNLFSTFNINCHHHKSQRLNSPADANI